MHRAKPMRRTKPMSLCLTGFTMAATLALLAGPPTVASAKAEPDKQAREILDATGVRGGVIVHLGCGDGRLYLATTNGAVLCFSQ